MSNVNVVREIRSNTRRRFTAEQKIRIVLEGLRGQVAVNELCRREGIAVNSGSGGIAELGVDARYPSYD